MRQNERKSFLLVYSLPAAKEAHLVGAEPDSIDREFLLVGGGGNGNVVSRFNSPNQNN